MIVKVPNLDVAFESRRRQMGKIEKIVADTWLDKYGGSFGRVGFNVPVYLNLPPEGTSGDASKRTLDVPEPYRVDIVGQFGDEVELIEVKESGNMTAIGQLLTYRMLFLRSYCGIKVIHLRLVCSKAREAIQEACRELGINLDQMYDECDDLIKVFRRGS